MEKEQGKCDVGIPFIGGLSPCLPPAAGHGGADEDGPARLAERHAVRLPDIQVLWDLSGVSGQEEEGRTAAPAALSSSFTSSRLPDRLTFDPCVHLLTASEAPKKAARGWAGHSAHRKWRGEPHFCFHTLASLCVTCGAGCGCQSILLKRYAWVIITLFLGPSTDRSWCWSWTSALVSNASLWDFCFVLHLNWLVVFVWINNSKETFRRRFRQSKLHISRLFSSHDLKYQLLCNKYMSLHALFSCERGRECHLWTLRYNICIISLEILLF